MVLLERLREGDSTFSRIEIASSTHRSMKVEEWEELLGLLSNRRSLRRVILAGNNLCSAEKNTTAALQCTKSHLVHSEGEFVEILLNNNNSSMETLDMSWCGLSDAKWIIAMATSLATNTSLRTLKLKGNDMSTDSVVAFAEALRYNSTLQHFEVSIGSCRSMEAIASMLTVNTTLHTLELEHTDRTTIEPFAACLVHNKTLRKLNLSGSWIFSSGCDTKERAFFRALGRNKGLQSLALCCMNISSPRVCRALADALAANTTLVDLNLSGNRLDIGASFQILVDRGLLRNKSITGLMIGNCSGPGTSAGKWKHPAVNALAKLVLRKKNKMGTIRRLDLSHTFFPLEPSLRAMVTNPFLLDLDLSYCGIPSVFGTLVDLLTHHTTLQKLNLSGMTVFDWNKVQALGKALAANQGLRTLLLRNSYFSAPDGVGCLLRGLAEQGRLQELDMSYTGNAQDTLQLAEIAKTHPSLTSIKLAGDQWSMTEWSACMNAFVEAARLNRRLVSVEQGVVPTKRSDHDWSASLHVLYSYLDMNRHGRHDLLRDHPHLLADLMGSYIDFRTKTNLVMENQEPLIQAIQGRYNTTRGNAVYSDKT